MLCRELTIWLPRSVLVLKVTAYGDDAVHLFYVEDNALKNDILGCVFPGAEPDEQCFLSEYLDAAKDADDAAARRQVAKTIAFSLNVHGRFCTSTSGRHVLAAFFAPPAFSPVNDSDLETTTPASMRRRQVLLDSDDALTSPTRKQKLNEVVPDTCGDMNAADVVEDVPHNDAMDEVPPAGTRGRLTRRSAVAKQLFANFL